MIASGGEDPQIASNAKLLSHLKTTLEKRGAKVVLSEHSPAEQNNVPLIADEIAGHQPKIDALIIHNAGTLGGANNDESLKAAVALTTELKDKLPVIINDWVDVADRLALGIVRDAGAKHVYLDPGVSEDKVAFAVSDAIAQQGKAGKTGRRLTECWNRIVRRLYAQVRS